MNLDYILFFTLIAGVLFLLLSMMCVFFYFKLKNEYDEYHNKKRNRRNKKKQKKMLDRLKVQKQKALLNSVTLIFVSLLCFAGAGGIRYYLRTNLSEKDTSNIAQSAYVLNETEKVLEQMKKENASGSKKEKKNFQTLTVRLSSYSASRADTRISKEGQLLLNRYYASLGQLGINTSSIGYDNLSRDKQNVDDYLHDIQKTREYQKKVIEFFKVGKDSLPAQK